MCSGIAKNNERVAQDIMVHAAATLYQISIELLNMERFIQEEDLQELFRVAKDHHCFRFLADPWKDDLEEFCTPTKEDCISLLEKMDVDLIQLVVDKLVDVKEDLDDAFIRIYDFQPLSTKYKKLEKKRLKISKVCIDAAAMLEIGGMYLVYMGIGRSAAFIDCKVDVFAGENYFLKVLGELDCTMVGKVLNEEDNMQL